MKGKDFPYSYNDKQTSCEAHSVKFTAFFSGLSAKLGNCDRIMCYMCVTLKDITFMLINFTTHIYDIFIPDKQSA